MDPFSEGSCEIAFPLSHPSRQPASLPHRAAHSQQCRGSRAGGCQQQGPASLFISVEMHLQSDLLALKWLGRIVLDLFVLFTVDLCISLFFLAIDLNSRHYVVVKSKFLSRLHRSYVEPSHRHPSCLLLRNLAVKPFRELSALGGKYGLKWLS